MGFSTGGTVVRLFVESGFIVSTVECVAPILLTTVCKSLLSNRLLPKYLKVILSKLFFSFNSSRRLTLTSHFFLSFFQGKQSRIAITFFDILRLLIRVSAKFFEMRQLVYDNFLDSTEKRQMFRQCQYELHTTLALFFPRKDDVSFLSVFFCSILFLLSVVRRQKKRQVSVIAKRIKPYKTITSENDSNRYIFLTNQ